MSLQNTTKENFFTPAPTIGKFEYMEIYGSAESTEEEELDDLGNAKEFHEYMTEKGHVFLTCKGKLLWYDPDEGFYQEENEDLKGKLFKVFGESKALETKYNRRASKHTALLRMLRSIVPREPDFYKKSQENTKGFFPFKNCIFDFNGGVSVPFNPKFYFTGKVRIDYKEHSSLFETKVLKVVCESIFGEGEKCELFMKLLARALAGEIGDKRFIVLLGATNSGKGTLTQLLGDCFGLGNFVGNYTAKELQGESATMDWLMLNKNCRIILANEINAEKPILLNNIKMCANGGEPITGKMLYKNKEHFVPQGTMFLCCNEMPDIKGNDTGDAVLNRMVYLETEYSYLKKQEYELKKADPKVRLADPNLKTGYLKRQDVQEAFASLIVKSYVPEAPALPECCIKKALEYKPKKSLKERLEKVFDFTGDENDYVPFSELHEHFQGSETTTAVGNALTKMGIRGTVKKVNGKARSVRVGIKLKDFQNTTEEYEGGTPTEISFADVDTVMTSPMKDGKVEGLMTENAELRAEVAELKEALKAKEQVPEGYDKALKTCMETKSETVKTATMTKALEGLLLKTTQQEETIAQLNAEQIDQLQRDTEAQDGLNDLLVKEEKKVKDLTIIIKQVERQTGTKVLDDDGGVLPDVLKRAKDVALVDTPDTE